MKDPGHKLVDCPRVRVRMECPRCKYPGSEARHLLPDDVWRTEFNALVLREQEGGNS